MTLRAVYVPQVLQSSFLFLVSFRLFHFGETDEQREKRLGRRPRSLICLCCGKNEILHQALRNSGPLDLTVTICHRGECFCLLYSTLLEGDRAPRGRSLLHLEKRRFCNNVCVCYALEAAIGAEPG